MTELTSQFNIGTEIIIQPKLKLKQNKSNIFQRIIRKHTDGIELAINQDIVQRPTFKVIEVKQNDNVQNAFPLSTVK